ncbi:hypothetical protein VTJ49DRAFT_3847 [Mycothermus thermophilus]|uniref:Nonribosomal peptide synthetase 12 n=1 Tax=Humicola insolens TaxID=85995 RepID=A0ABR3VQU1_HUMIN
MTTSPKLLPPPPTRPPRPSSLRYPLSSHPPHPSRTSRPAPIVNIPPHFRAHLAAAPTQPPSPPLGKEEHDEATDCESECSDDDAELIPSKALIFAGLRSGSVRPPRDIEAQPRPARSSASLNSTASTIAATTTPPLDSKEFNHPLTPTPSSATKSGDLFTRHGLPSCPLPPKHGSRLYRYLRWNFGSVYRRLFALVYLANIAAMTVLVFRRITSGDPLSFTRDHAATAATANVLAAILVRNEHVVNALFRIACSSWIRGLPLRARTLAAKVYSYGGIHSGGAVAATSWYVAFVVLLTVDWAKEEGDPGVLRGYVYLASYLVLALLVCMLISAHPSLRRVMHNWFEGIHRFMGWLAVILLWAQVLLLAAEAGMSPEGAPSFGGALVRSPTFWMLIAITLLVIYPWTRLRLREVHAEVLSEHCLKLTFRNTGFKVDYGQAFRITDAPLRETHAFGVIPLPPSPATAHHCPGCTCTRTPSPSGMKQPPTTRAEPLEQPTEFSLLIAKAGDWTSNLIANPPRRLYTRGVPQFGVLRVAGLFSPVVAVATGAGIAPILGLLDSPACRSGAVRVRVVWAARAPVKTFGEDVVRTVYKADPEAVVVDTEEEEKRRKASGGKGNRPDLVGLAYRVWEDGKEVVKGEGKRRAEAVVIISNQKVTEKVVYGLESRGVPAFGAIFDS